ncbi:MAG: hypothetical protein GY778_23270 [bacterium]|nr:hypothetical protein [bacterium]
MSTVQPAWLVAPAWRDRFPPPESIDWSALANDPRAELVKSNPQRRVWRVSVGQEQYYVKQFLHRAWTDRGRGLLGAGRGGGEWRCTLEAVARGVACVAPVAYGRLRSLQGILGRSTEFLVTQAAPKTTPLPEAWQEVTNLKPPRQRGRAGLALVDAVADLCARAHNAGLGHRDNHPGNILIRDAGTLEPAALYVDLYGATMGQSLSDGCAAAGLAQLDQWFARHASQSQRLRFLRRYCARRFGWQDPTAPQLRQWSVMIGRARWDQARRLFAQRDRRFRRGGRYFARIKLSRGWSATVTLRFRNRAEFPEPVHPDRTVEQWQDSLEKLPARIDSGESGWADVRMLGSGSNPTAPVSDTDVGPPVRCLHLPPRADGTAWVLTGTPAWRAFATGHGLRHRNLPGVWPLAVLERRRGRRTVDSVLLVEDRPNAMPLTGVLDPEGTGDVGSTRILDDVQRAAVFHSIGRLLADAVWSGVRWLRPDPSALLIEWPDDRPLAPRALFGQFGDLTFHRRVSSNHAARMVETLLEHVRACPGVDAADVQSLADAYRNRVQWLLGPPDGWPS